MNNPIITVIKNNLNEDRFIRWTGEGTVWVGANASVEVPYEVWSKADRKQRVSILADTQQKNVTLTLKVLSARGEYTAVAFNPDATIVQEAKTPAPKVISTFAEDGKKDDQMHTIKANSRDVKAAASHYGVAVVPDAGEPVSIKVEGTSTNGFSVVTEDTEVRKTVYTEQRAAAEQDDGNDAVPAVVEELQEEVSDEPSAAAPSFKQRFDEAVEGKDWDKALDILIEEFGKDKVTITKRVVMAMKDYDAIVKKYGFEA